jgi:hypothetical protein
MCFRPCLGKEKKKKKLKKKTKLYKRYVDLGALPSKRLIRALAEECRSPFDKKKMMDLCEISNSGKEKYAQFADTCGGLKNNNNNNSNNNNNNAE